METNHKTINPSKNKTMTLSKKIKQLRKLNNCTQQEFAHLLGIGYTTFQKYETGAVFPRFEWLQKICKKFPEYTLWLIIDDSGVQQCVPALKENEQRRPKSKKHKQHIPKSKKHD